MSYSPKEFKATAEDIATRLRAIQEVLEDGAKVTLIIRHEMFPGGYFIISDDHLGNAKLIIDRSLEKKNFGEILDEETA